MNEAKLVITHQKSQGWYLAVVAIAISALVGVFIFGRYFALSDLSSTKSHLKEASTELSKSQLELRYLKEQLVMQRQSSQVDSHSSIQLVDSVKKLQQSQNDLEAELQFYRRIMAPEMAKDGLKVDGFQISSSDNPNQYHFRLTLIQAGKQSQYLKGDIRIQVNGLLNGKKTAYDVRELGIFKPKHFDFQFKYFQNIQGVLQLPSGFTAKNIRISGKTKGRGKRQEIDESINWKPQES